MEKISEVAPFAGAWIEIQPMKGKSDADIVAPFAGAWIEILFLVCHAN